MKKEKSCGAVVVRREEGSFKTLLIQNKNGGHWAFPKGHVEGTETEKETAVREVKEETGLDIVINTDFRAKVQYSPKAGVTKDVVYFLAVVNTDKTKRQEEEIDALCWMDVENAVSCITFERDKEVMQKAAQYIKQHLN